MSKRAPSGRTFVGCSPGFQRDMHVKAPPKKSYIVYILRLFVRTGPRFAVLGVLNVRKREYWSIQSHTKKLIIV